ncbi:hypothetical protein HWV62_21644 [Athelia sp. TMB]|nr:hypothetical protein HWV62_21644 [Athelia sp. TMB]
MVRKLSFNHCGGAVGEGCTGTVCKKDIIGRAPTGAGKTLSFFGGLAIAMEEEPEEDHMIIIVSPLNLLSKQNVDILQVAGIRAISLTGENNNEMTFEEIELCKYRVIIIPPDFVDGVTSPPPKFLVFFKSTKATELALHAGHENLPPELRHKVRYFHAGMTQAYQEEMYEGLKSGDVWGLCVTTAFGFGMDLLDVDVVAQWRVTCNMCNLWQYFGQVARATSREGTGILFCERTHLDKNQKNKKAAAVKQKTFGDSNDHASKRPATSAAAAHKDNTYQMEVDLEVGARQTEREVKYS